MKTFPYVNLVLIIISTLAFPQQWLFMNGPYGGTIHKFATDPIQQEIVYAAVSSSHIVHKSIDGGLSWFESGPDTVIGSLYLTIAIDPQNTNNVYLGAWDGLFKSINSGNDWLLTSLPHNRVASIALDPANPDIIYAGIYLSQNNECLWKSTDGGFSWEIKSNGIPPPIGTQSCIAITVNPINPNSIYAGVSYAGVYKTINAGESWNYIAFSGGTVQDIAIAPWDTSLVFAATMAGLFKSTNSGGNWYEVLNGVLSIEINSVNQTIYAGTNQDGIYKSTDLGETWLQINNQLPVSLSNAMRVNDIAVLPYQPDQLLLGTEVGAYRSSDGGESWYQNSNGILGYSAYDISNTSNEPSVLLTSGYQGVQLSTDSGTSWKYIGGGGTAYLIATDYFNSQIIYIALSYVTNADYIWRTSDGGISWEITSASVVGGFQYLETDPNDPNIVYASRYFGFFRSTDAGVTWSTISTPFGLISSMDIQKGNSQIIYMGSREGVYRTTDRGVSWDSLGLGGFNQDIVVRIHPQKPDTIYAGICDQGFFRSTDGGQNWEEKNINLTNTCISEMVISPSDGNKVYLGTNGGGIFFSNNAGEEWIQLIPLPPSLTVRALGFKNVGSEKLIASFHAVPGLYYYDIPTSVPDSTKEYVEVLPNTLLSNYPNPFNSTTSIRFYLPESDEVSLTIYDILGSEVFQLISNQLLNAGWHEYNLNTNHLEKSSFVLSSGVYMYAIKTSGGIKSKKMIYLK